MTMAPLIVLSGPSASGKSTLIARLLAEGAWPLRLSVSATTRSQRPGEEEGRHYYFWTRERFLNEVAVGAFLEWADVFGNLYGTPASEVTPHRLQGTGVLLDIDVQGWAQVRERCPDAVSIFIRTSSLETLEKRLRERKTESEASIRKRLEGARAELARAGEYRHHVINDDLDQALGSLRAIVGPLFERTKNAG